VARWPGGQVAKWGQVEDHDRVQDQVREQGTFAQGKLFLVGVLIFKKKKKKIRHMLLTGFGSLFWAFCAQIENFLVHFIAANIFLGYFEESG
jgi:hypothetical protein